MNKKTYSQKYQKVKGKFILNLWKTILILSGLVFFLGIFASVYFNQYRILEKENIELRLAKSDLVSAVELLHSENLKVSTKMRYLQFREWVIDKIFPIVKKDNWETVLKVSPIVYKSARKYKLSPKVVMRLIRQESHFEQYAQSKVAYGFVQINYSAWKNKFNLSDFSELFDADYNIDRGCYILRYYLNKECGDYSRALYRYNNGYLYDNKKYVPAVMGKKL